MKRILCLFLLITLVTFGVNVLAQDQPKDLEIKVIPLSEKDSQETKQVWDDYLKASKKWEEKRKELQEKYVPFSQTSTVLYWSNQGNVFRPLPEFVISKDFGYLLVTREPSTGVVYGYGTGSTLLTK